MRGFRTFEEQYLSSLKRDFGEGRKFGGGSGVVPGVDLISEHSHLMTADNKSRKSMDFVPLPPVLRFYFPPEIQGGNKFEIQAGEEQNPWTFLICYQPSSNDSVR